MCAQDSICSRLEATVDAQALRSSVRAEQRAHLDPQAVHSAVGDLGVHRSRPMRSAWARYLLLAATFFFGLMPPLARVSRLANAPELVRARSRSLTVRQMCLSGSAPGLALPGDDAPRVDEGLSLPSILLRTEEHDDRVLLLRSWTRVSVTQSEHMCNTSLNGRLV